MLGATAGALVAFPVVVPGLAVADLLRGRWRLPAVRVYLFLLQYGVNDSFEILAAPVLWFRAGVGTRLGSEPSLRRHERIQRWSIEVLGRRAERLLGVRIELDPVGTGALGPGPLIVLSRHVNLLDASLPALLLQREGYRVRSVIMAEMLADPGFDLLYGRTGSAFITREDDPAARQAVARLAAGLTGQTAVVIFPEGRLFRPDALLRALARLASSDPARAERLAGLAHVLPPRSGGVLALLDQAPQADVVVISHVGLDRFATFDDLARAVPLRHPVKVAVRRISRDSVPADAEARAAWLDEVWVEVDRHVAAELER